MPVTKHKNIRIIFTAISSAIFVFLFSACSLGAKETSEKDWIRNAKEYIRLDKTISNNLGKGDYSMTVPLHREKFTAKLINGSAPDMPELIQYIKQNDSLMGLKVTLVTASWREMYSDNLLIIFMDRIGKYNDFTVKNYFYRYLFLLDSVHLKKCEDRILLIIKDEKDFNRLTVVLSVLEKLSPEKTLDQYIRALRSNRKWTMILAMGTILRGKRLDEIKDRLKKENDRKTLEIIGRMEKYGRDFDQHAPVSMDK